MSASASDVSVSLSHDVTGLITHAAEIRNPFPSPNLNGWYKCFTDFSGHNLHYWISKQILPDPFQGEQVLRQQNIQGCQLTCVEIFLMPESKKHL